MTERSRSFWTWIFSLLLAVSLIWTGINSRLYKEGESVTAYAAEIASQSVATHEEVSADPAEASNAENVDDAVSEDTWVVLHGIVVAYTEDGENALTIQTDAGETLEMGLGPSGYWLAHGIAFSPGDEVNVRGFYNEEFELASIENLTTGESVTLRDDDGIPLWRGSH